jgi:hypothetical protein
MSRVVEVVQYGTAATGGRRLKVEVGRVGRQGATGATGATGPAGATGATGAQGPAGQGVPVGGSTGQVLSKVSGADYDTTWSTVSGGGGAPAAHAASHQDGGSDELALDASQLTSGTVATARLGSGTPNAGTFLRGDQTWGSTRALWVPLSFSNADYTITETVSVVLIQNGTLSAPRTVTLPAADNGLPGAIGREIIVWSGAGVSATNTLSVQAASGEKINTSTSPFVITQPNQMVRFICRATIGTFSQWVVDTFDVDGSHITSGTVPFARLPVGTTSTTVTVGDDARLSDARTPTSHKVSHQAGGSDELALSATQLTSGTVAAARLGSGTANSSSYLRGDQTWATPPAGWTIIADDLLASDTASVSYTVTGYDQVHVILSARSTRNSTSDNLNVTLNSDTSSVYSTNAAALTTFWSAGVLPAITTNTDRHQHVDIRLSLTDGYTKAGYSLRSTLFSTSTVGGAPTLTGLFSTLTGAITSIQLAGNLGDLAAGSHIRVVGLEA